MPDNGEQHDDQFEWIEHVYIKLDKQTTLVSIWTSDICQWEDWHWRPDKQTVSALNQTTDINEQQMKEIEQANINLEKLIIVYSIQKRKQYLK